MPSLSERIDGILYSGDVELWRIIKDMAKAIESLTESNHSLATKCESMQLRIEELEAQLTALAPPKSAGTVVEYVPPRLSLRAIAAVAKDAYPFDEIGVEGDRVWFQDRFDCDEDQEPGDLSWDIAQDIREAMESVGLKVDWDSDNDTVFGTISQR